MRRLLLVGPLLAALACDSTEPGAPKPGTPKTLQVLSGDNQTGVVATQLGQAVAIAVLDSAQRRVPGQTVTFHVTAGGGSTFSGTATTNDTGIVVERWTLGPHVSDPQRLEARLLLPNGQTLVTSISATPIAGNPSRFAVVAAPTYGWVGEGVAVRPTVRVFDAFDNAVGGALITFSVAEGGGTAGGATVVSDASGMATVGSWTLGASSGLNTLDATAGSAIAHFQVRTYLVTAIASGRSYVCALVDDGKAYCWGSPSPSTSNTLVGTDTYVSIVAGNQVSCGLKASGAAMCWGLNEHGEVGDGTHTDRRNTPTPVSGALLFASLSIHGDHVCGLAVDGAAYCWGSDSDLQLGHQNQSSAVPVRVGLPGAPYSFASISAGQISSCAVNFDGTGMCWGSATSDRLGVHRSSGSAFPVAVSGGLTYTVIHANAASACGLRPSGAAYCWGFNGLGQVGDGTTADSRATPTAVIGGLTFGSLAVGGVHTCGLTTAGTAYCWGYNDEGAAGDGSLGGARTAPVAVTGGHTFTQLSAGYDFTCGLTSSQKVYCWGFNFSGAFGPGAIIHGRYATPQLIPIP